MKIIFLLLFPTLLFITAHSQNLRCKTDALVSATADSNLASIINDILKEHPSPDTLLALLKETSPGKPEKTGLIRAENSCTDKVTRPFYWYVPATYNPAKKTALIVYLHGSVSRDTINEKTVENNIKGTPYVKKNIYLPMVEQNGYILLLPLGQKGATWWDSVGASNILDQIRITKSRFNIDDNRIYLSGFSDGASGSFFMAMSHPTDFAAFIPLNGYPALGSRFGTKQNYFYNLYNKPLHVINTGRDILYPDSAIRPIIELAQQAGANLMYRSYEEVGHVLGYSAQEIPRIEKFMNTHPRAVHPPLIKWETAYSESGRCAWLSIDKINSTARAAAWHEEYNMDVADSKIAWGFEQDETYKGAGVRVAKTEGDNSLCASVGIKEGDIIVKMDGKPVKTMQDAITIKNDKKRGDSVEVTVLREGKEFFLKGKLPPPGAVKLFNYDLPSARIEASFAGNVFHIKQSRVGAFSLYIHPDMVQLSQPVVVYVNGKKVFDEKVFPDAEFMLRNFAKNKDRELMYVKKISIPVN